MCSIPWRTMRWRRAILAGLFAGFSLTHARGTAASSGDPPPRTSAVFEAAEKAFRAGNDLLEHGRYAEASAQYQKALVLLPDSSGLLWNGGIAAYLGHDYATALSRWQHLKGLDPTNGLVRAKLILTYQAIDDLKARDNERQSLFALRRSGDDPELAKQDFYCRDQFTAAGHEVYAYEFFDLKGERALRYNFLILRPDGTVDFRISLGSYSTTNAIARELGHLKPGQRLFHLDGYDNPGQVHRTYAFYEGEPSYETVKRHIIQVLAGQKKAMSSLMVLPAGPAKSEVPKAHRRNSPPRQQPNHLPSRKRP